MKVAHDIASASPARGPDAAAAPVAFRLWHAALRDAAWSYLADREGGLVYLSRGLAELLGVGEAPRLPPHLLDGVKRLAEYPFDRVETIELGGAAYRAASFPIFAADGELLGAAGILEPEAAAAEAAPPPTAGLQLAAIESAMDEAERRIGEIEGAFTRATEESRRKTALLGTISHELRTPLNAIIGFAEIALRQARGPLPAAYRGYFDDIAAAGRHMGDLVETLLDAARLESGEMSIERRPVSARLLMGEARSIVALRAEEEQVDLSEVQLKGDWLLDVDPVRGRQIFVNLLANAIKFTPAGGQVGVDVTRLSDELVDIAIWDSGVGIAPAHQAKVFDAFFQVPGAKPRSGTPKGAGLGLAISRQIAQAMGGDILLASEPGKGSRFTVRLRLAEASLSKAVG
jgi:signal transduction histidine kinase